MKCPRCGTENPAGKIVCRQCGARLRAVPAGQQAIVRETQEELMARVRADVRRIAWVTGAVMAVGVALGYLLPRL